jgi:hypothetical protein
MIGKAIKSRLTDVSAVNTIVSGRIFPQWNAKPQAAVAYERTGGSSVNSYSGSSGLESAQMRLSCLATTYEGAIDLGKKVKAALDGQSGTWGTVVVRGAFYQGGDDDAHQLDEGIDTPMFVFALDFLFWFET